MPADTSAWTKYYFLFYGTPQESGRLHFNQKNILIPYLYLWKIKNHKEIDIKTLLQNQPVTVIAENIVFCGFRYLIKKVFLYAVIVWLYVGK